MLIIKASVETTQQNQSYHYYGVQPSKTFVRDYDTRYVFFSLNVQYCEKQKYEASTLPGVILKLPVHT